MEDFPKKVAIILDGNRRYAKKLGLKTWKGHEFGLRKVESLLEWCEELGIKELTLYCFSMDNFKRSDIEKNFLFGLFNKTINKLEKDERLDRNKIKISFIGRIDMFPKDMQENMKRLMEKTKEYGNFKLNFAMAYSSKAEITDAVEKIIQKRKNNEISDVDEKLIEDNLYLSSKPDILIRTGGEKRLSDFLLWQSAYSELIFLDKLWPEFTKEDLIWCIEEFKRRERRFGR